MFTINKNSNIDLDSGKENFHSWAIEGVGNLLKDLSVFSGKEVIDIFSLAQKISNSKDDTIHLSEDEVAFLRKYLGNFR